MSMAVSPEQKNNERRQQVFLGPLPSDFLRINVSAQQLQEAADRQAAMALQQQYSGMPAYPQQNYVGKLNITVAQAKLVKNYGMTRMDPYVRLRVGHCVYETHTDSNGGKNPHWNKVVQCLLAQRVNSIYLEIYDECSFTVDELIAWAHIPIPEAVMNGETIDEWYALNGKQGDGQEGNVNLVLSFSTQAPNMPPQAYPLMYQSMTAPVVMVPSATGFGVQPMTVYQMPPTMPQAQQQAPPPAPQITEEEYKMIEEMFKNMDKEVIRSVFEANRGNKEATINNLLQMNE
ncbi:toll-interacting protein-like [Neocloeon triangulifer]|uniref:toll-interacting protein-like n=1 Tax=Neocloeon triangulifer TaxID=2078957 RepID=UPI00286F84C0|nr:toll-interacting protein-like [Neocloeon triangulifer]